ncbi:hypothetical protein QBC38DRAFT_450402 [Podospora fimiseda]|uniref:Uncharacterized protein n=1 Tax=Podospora fimiseda TaxID=252190 RepID=A0AAN7BZ41_9PEZI|nr:hypothetical protein QBC38DRAFT_450402 [Podospora fimiseda]
MSSKHSRNTGRLFNAFSRCCVEKSGLAGFVATKMIWRPFVKTWRIDAFLKSPGLDRPNSMLNLFSRPGFSLEKALEKDHNNSNSGLRVSRVLVISSDIFSSPAMTRCNISIAVEGTEAHQTPSATVCPDRVHAVQQRKFHKHHTNGIPVVTATNARMLPFPHILCIANTAFELFHKFEAGVKNKVRGLQEDEDLVRKS